MSLKTPLFWKNKGPLSTLLVPLSALYRLGGHLCRHSQAASAGVPVICVGNVVAGGTGKTPVVLDLLGRLKELGHNAAALSRGYGGHMKGPVMVDPNHHQSGDVGDEALLLARAAPTWVSHKRLEGARQAAATGADIIVMDDGFQNPALGKDLSFLVVDGGFGFGNGRLLPAGPMRETLNDALTRTDALVLIGNDDTGALGQVKKIAPDLPVLNARLIPRETEAEKIKGVRVFAFAGIGRPEKFFDTLLGAGATLVGKRAFGDHHVFTPSDLAQLRQEAAHEGARLLTTEKDFVRLSKPERDGIDTLGIELVWDDEGAVMTILSSVLNRPGGDS